ncbi:MAG TPA: glycoside hydrolase family 75 protein [Amycolatopsis sp.]|nr:glycoside hydrolase family 75 protein [Amycolatopsis sp.]HET6708417.1 glycoside hydrolase family 75 protein [Amycolatopsis sp.]
MRRILVALMGCALLALSLTTGSAQAAVEAGPSASQLIAKTQNCQQISHGRYSHDEGGAATVPVCQANGAVFFTADMDIDCDGVRTTQCNENTDCCFYPDTAFHTSTDQPLNAAQLPYVVLPQPTSTWDYHNYGIDGGSVVAVIYNNQVTYAVVGDTGPASIIGEASYATAVSLGIDPDPKTGGTEGPVTYVVFPNTHVNPIESQANAVSLGEQVATRFAGGTTPTPAGPITGIGGKCLDVTSAGTANGTTTQLWDCNGSNAQKWSANGAQNLVNTGSGKCPDATGNSSANGTRLQIWTCGSGANQKWTLS